jgi:hypothetical protein
LIAIETIQADHPGAIDKAVSTHVAIAALETALFRGSLGRWRYLSNPAQLHR